MPSVPTKPEIEAMDDKAIQAAHRFGRQHEKKVRREIQNRRKTDPTNLPPGFVPKPSFPIAPPAGVGPGTLAPPEIFKIN